MRKDRSKNHFQAKGKFLTKFRSTIFLLPAWFSPHYTIRVLFHRLRGVKIGKKVEIGYFCIIGNVHPHLITIEDGAVITAGACLLEHDNAYFYSRNEDVKWGPVVIKKNAFIGLHSVILPNITVGERSIVAANSVVLRNIPPDTVVGGVPSITIRKLSSPQ